MISDAEMAWMLADAADVCLTGHERTMTFVELGSSENHLAIERILNAVMSSQMTLPAARPSARPPSLTDIGASAGARAPQSRHVRHMLRSWSTTRGRESAARSPWHRQEMVR